MITQKLKPFSLLLLAITLSLLVGCVQSKQLPKKAPTETETAEPEVVLAALSTDNSAEGISRLFPEIYKGRFDLAREIIESNDVALINSDQLVELKKIISEYESIENGRNILRENAYAEQMAELEKIRKEAEVNEPNDLSEVFTVILKVHEFADAEQKKVFLEDTFVKQTIQKAENTAAQFEADGQWLDALIKGYSWLAALYEDDKKYTNARERLTGKLMIKAALQDSPCESYQDRYEGIKEKMFVRAIDLLSQAYVGMVDYGDMVTKSVQRCELLAEVLRFADANTSAKSASQLSSMPTESPLPEGGVQPLETFDSIDIEFNREKIPAFLQAVSGLKADFEGTFAGTGKDKFVGVFNKVLALNEATIKLPKEILIAQFAEASLDSLDPHTTLIWPWQTRDFEKSMTNEFTGIGIEISNADGRLKAISLLPGTPAYYSGLDAGDIIEAVDGESTKDMTINCAVSKITGPAGTKVRLTVKHEDREETEDIIITRAKIIVPTIRGWQRTDEGLWRYLIDLEEKIGYVRITNFSGTTVSDFEKTLRKIEQNGLDALILDLRYNSGGYLQAAAQITDVFIDKGIIVQSKPRFGYRSMEVAHKKGTHPGYPLIILQNSSSASASEIVAGALASHNRAILVGTRSYGKGTVQTITDYPGGGAQLKYTMAHYLLPGDKKVKSRYEMEKLGRKDWGIASDVEVKLRSDEIKGMFDIQKKNDVLFKADHNNNHSQAKRYTIEETLQADAQLAVGILIAKTKLIEQKHKK